MRRREFISLIGGAAAFPLAARAQSAEGARVVGVFMPGPEDDPERQSYAAFLRQGLEKHGSTIGRDLHINFRWNIGSVERTETAISELLALKPDVLVGGTSGTLAAATQNVPIVFFMIYEPSRVVALFFFGGCEKTKFKHRFSPIEPDTSSGC